MNEISLTKLRFAAIAVLLLFVSTSIAIGNTDDQTVGMKPDFTSETENRTGDSQSKDGSPEETKTTTEKSFWRAETILALSVIGFSLLVLYVQYHLVMKDTVDWTPNAIIRFFGLTLIINGGVLLVVAGFSNQQIAGVLGLLGSIAGYLLGASSKGSTDGDSRTASNSREATSPTPTDSNDS